MELLRDKTAASTTFEAGELTPRGLHARVRGPRARQPASSNLRSLKSARAAQERTALITAVMMVTAMLVSLADSTRRGRSHHHDGSKGVKIKVNLLAVRVMFNDNYACNRLYVSDVYTRCARA